MLLVLIAVARFDFSWGDADYHQETLGNLKADVKSTSQQAVSLGYCPLEICTLRSSLFRFHIPELPLKIFEVGFLPFISETTIAEKLTG